MMLDRLMDGLPTPTDVALPSDGVVARQSTDTIAVEDPHLAAALHFIHDHLNKPFGIDQVVGATSISRRQLEARFCRVLNCTPLDYLSRKRIERAKQMLSTPDKIKFHKLVAACGFSNVEQMRQTFKRVIGMTPLEYRQAELEKRGKKAQQFPT
jgi:LacI family transcriptional regulator